MVAEKVHIYLPGEIDQIEPMSELERCADYVFTCIKGYAKDIPPNGYLKHCPIYCGDRFTFDTVYRIGQLLTNAGWDIAGNGTNLYIHKRHFE